MRRFVNSTPEVKSTLINRILAQSVYTPESGLVLQLRKALEKLSGSDLMGLETLVSIGREDARQGLEASSWKDK